MWQGLLALRTTCRVKHRNAKLPALAYRIGQILGTSEEVAAQVHKLEMILRIVKFGATLERMEKLKNMAPDGYSCIF